MAKVTFPRTLRNVDARQLSRALDENMRYLETLLNKTFNFDHTILANVTADQHHVKYTDSEVDTIVATHTALPSAHHSKYLDADAVSAMGAKADSNPLNHDQAAGAAGERLHTREIYTADATWTKADYTGITRIIVRMVGGGGGGGGSAVTGGSEGSASGGGGGGGYAESVILAAALGATEAVTRGTAGGGGAIGAAGGGGGDSSFGTHVVAKGATGGGHMAASSALPFGAQGGAGGQRSAATGDLIFDGETGGNTLVQTAIRSWRNGGGASFFGRASNARFSGSGNSGGDTGGDYGGGGTGAWSSQSNSGAVGGDGGIGIVIVDVYVSD